MKNLFISLIAVTFIQTILNYPPPQPVQASQSSEIKTTQNKPLKGTQKKKVVKHATKKKKPVRKPQKQSVAVSRVVQPTTTAPSGSCRDWIRSAGVKDIDSAYILIMKESTCNPNAVNPSSGACNVAQELPCGKSGCSLGDGACSVKWMNQYVIARYGSWANAIEFHNRNSWY